MDSEFSNPAEMIIQPFFFSLLKKGLDISVKFLILERDCRAFD